ncbi:MAG TPA: hypothetical protein VM121_00295 [Acidimicrobiales bacterium]|nr:hypothetical protein [Acidimicrobiales bacterium]
MPLWRRSNRPARLRLANRPVASSFHLWWRFPPGAASAPFVEVSATCEVVVPPAVDSLYFWALQVGFGDGHDDRGAGHTGLQWHGHGARRRAVNWGGYRAERDGGGELRGSVSQLGRLDQNGNTVAYPWEPGRRYRFRIARAGNDADNGAGDGDGDRRWRSTVTDLTAGESTVIRDLYAPGQHLVSPVVWSEVFAGCDAPSVMVRWSGLEARTAAGDVLRPAALSVTYQDEAAGGCENTDVGADDLGVTQTTNTARQIRAGAEVRYPAARQLEEGSADSA